MKRNGLFVLAVTLALCLPSFPAHGQLPAAVVNYGREFARDVAGFRAAYIAATNGIPLKYKRDLEAMQATFQKAGDLDGLLAVKKEIERYRKVKTDDADPFEAVPEMTADVIVDAPPELRKLQEQYVASFTDAAATLKKNIADRGDKYRTQIKAAQTALTRAGKIDEAIAVRNESDRVSKILDSGDIEALLGTAAVTPAATPTPTSQPTSARDNVRKPQSSATKWQLLGTYAFSRDLPRYLAPDVPNELSADYNAAKAIGTLSGRCTVAAAQVGDVLCSWNGRAFIWDVANPDDLATDIRVKSRTLSSSAKSGPQLEVAVLTKNGIRLKSLSVPLMKADEIVKIVRNPDNVNRFALFWPYGGKSEPFDIPAGSTLKVLVGAVLNNPGETCDLSFQLVPVGAN